MAQLCLKWNNFENTLAQCLLDQYEQGLAVDCTLACEGDQLKAHKCVLMACSPYFERLLSANPCKHPIVILKDVRFADLKALIDFMYRGEVTVGHDQLPSLLKTATTLEVKQLAEMTTTRQGDEQQQQQAMRSRKRKRTRQRGQSGRGDGGDSGESGNESSVPKQQIGTTYVVEHGAVIEGQDGQQVALAVTDGNGNHGSSRILELSMAEVVGNEGHEASEEVTSDGVETGHVVTEGQEGQLALVSSGDLTGDEHSGTLMSLSMQDDSQIMVFRKKQSFVWEYFSETGKGSVKCKKCAKLLSYKDTSGSTSNMIKHLKTVHSVERTFKPPLQE